jgi:hypothetical protein
MFRSDNYTINLTTARARPQPSTVSVKTFMCSESGKQDVLDLQMLFPH